MSRIFFSSSLDLRTLSPTEIHRQSVGDVTWKLSWNETSKLMKLRSRVHYDTTSFHTLWKKSFVESAKWQMQKIYEFFTDNPQKVRANSICSFPFLLRAFHREIPVFFFFRIGSLHLFRHRTVPNFNCESLKRKITLTTRNCIL